MSCRSRVQAVVKTAARVVPVVTVLVVAGCATTPRSVTTTLPAARPGSPGAHGVAPAGVGTPGAPGAVLHLQGPAGITTIDIDGGRWIAPGGVATPDWGTIFNVANGQLRTLDGVTGAVRASQAVAPGLRPVVSSVDGQAVALADTPVRIGQGVFPPGRSHSTIVIVPASPASGAPRTIELDGNVVPEGFSGDHSQLFVIEFLPPAQPDRYRVRSINIATGALGPVYTFDKSIDTEVMQGLSRTQVFSQAGAYGPMLYTLYSRADGPSAGYGEVHALSLDGGFVHCTDLPPNLDIGPEGGAIAVSPDGQHVYVANEKGAVAEIDVSGSSQTELFPIGHDAQLVPGPGSRTVALAASNRGVWVALGSQVSELDATSLRTVTTINMGSPVEALTLTAGGQLYVATPASIDRIDPTTQAWASIATTDPTATRIAAV